MAMPDQKIPLAKMEEVQEHTRSGCYTTRPISHEEASEAFRRFENLFWKREPGPRISIPARPDHDDDLIIMAYLEQQERRDVS